MTARDILVERIEIDLVGCSSADEVLNDRPSDRYLTGILFPNGAKLPSEEDEQLETEGEEDVELGSESVPLFSALRPSTAGLSFAVASMGEEPPSIDVVVKCGTYRRHWVDAAGNRANEKGSLTRRDERWSRTDHRVEIARIKMSEQVQPVDLGEHGLSGLQIYFRVTTTDGITLVTAALLNTHMSGQDRAEDEHSTFFQAGLSVTPSEGTRFVARPSRKVATDEDGLVSTLIYRNVREYAVGHTCSADWRHDESGKVTCVRTTWMPRALIRGMSAKGDIAFQKLRATPNIRPLSADWLSGARRDELTDALSLLPRCYSEWLDGQEERISELPSDLRPQATLNVAICRQAQRRMDSAVNLLRSDEKVRTAFRLAQKAMLIQRRWTKPDDGPLEWRPFQLGFQLLALESLANREHPDRSLMDLLWFPTGGGKTEAYLALTAFIFFLRRLRGDGGPDGAGVAVLMRYTLRLLTIQQFQRAAALVLACEFLRRGKELPAGVRGIPGNIPFSIGLWVGGGATPNKFEEARAALTGANPGSTPRQLVKCPCCRQTLRYTANQTQRAIEVSCESGDCAFAATGKQLPVWTVDEDIYRTRPSLVIATVDKFAQLARKAETGVLFGLGTAHDAPDLIIQDELHLISGPLGTITALYEVAVDELCSHGGVRPKIIGSTATIRRAREQVRALFDRNTYQFPPPCIDAANSGFAVEDREAPGRLYVGATSAGRSPKFMLQAATASLLQGASDSRISADDRDWYWTLVAYFNSLRELGGAVVLMQDDVGMTVTDLARRHLEKERDLDAPVELTSRVSSSEIPEILEQLEVHAGEPDSVDVLLASNMISVGVDVSRLGVMVVNGQPKGIAEYIQATSRVGRGPVPGLVLTLFNHGRVRDRSAFETFSTWHGSLYREVEATSVTPFASRARDKALHAVLVALIRHRIPALRDQPKLDAASLKSAVALAGVIEERARRIDSDESHGVSAKLENLLGAWETRSPSLQKYWSDSPTVSALMMSAEQYAAFGKKNMTTRVWPTPNSMREVEPGTPFKLVSRLRTQEGGGDAEE
jgi:hypothetical protein